MALARIFKRLGLGILGLSLALAFVYWLLDTAADTEVSFLPLLVVILGINGMIWLVIAFALQGSFQRRESRQQHIYKNGIPANGTVVSLKPNRTVRVNRQYPYTYVEFTFEDETGHSHTQRDSYLSETVVRLNLQPGSRVTVYYLPNDPRRCTLAGLLE
ncbi:MAG: DUF3592 domain-containing protein [Anaerolineae bacterium]|nr:DUF3592 domain-containing protein [Anaerolineae bacterium]